MKKRILMSGDSPPTNITSVRNNADSIIVRQSMAVLLFRIFMAEVLLGLLALTIRIPKLFAIDQTEGIITIILNQ